MPEIHSVFGHINNDDPRITGSVSIESNIALYIITNSPWFSSWFKGNSPTWFPVSRPPFRVSYGARLKANVSLIVLQALPLFRSAAATIQERLTHFFSSSRSPTQSSCCVYFHLHAWCLLVCWISLTAPAFWQCKVRTATRHDCEPFQDLNHCLTHIEQTWSYVMKC